jgi:hypothetical protein
MTEQVLQADVFEGKPKACVEAVTVSGTVASGVCIERIDVTGGDADRFLPVAANVIGRTYIFVKEDASANVANVKPQGADVIEPGGLTVYALPNQWDRVKVVALKAGVYVLG